MNHKIYYPSGIVLSVFARYFGFVVIGEIPAGPLGSPVLDVLESTIINRDVISAGSAMLVDPRCVIVDENGKIVYTPRPHVNQMEKPMRDWLKQHRDWPKRLRLAK